MTKSKEYKIPKEIINLFVHAGALLELRDIYSKLPFGFKKAKKCAIEGRELIQEFWDKIHEIYPELHDKVLSYNNFDYVTVQKDKKGNMLNKGENRK